MNTSNYHLIEVKYIAPTDYKGARVKLTSKRFNCSVIRPRDYATNGAMDQAIDELERAGFNIVGAAEWDGVDYIITDTFKPFKAN
jgi:hypothetical protein